MSHAVTIQTGSRLHFGMLNHRPPEGRVFGGLGVMISEPGWTVTASVAASDSIRVTPQALTEDAAIPERVRKLLSRLRDEPRFAAGLEMSNTAGLAVEISRAIPGHHGLGSGTQLGLALSQAIAQLIGLSLSASELAIATGRGRRSAIGIWGFEQGGFLVDGGKLNDASIGTLIARFPVPSDWRFVLATPRTQPGLSGEAEINAFASLPVMPIDTTRRLCHLALLQILPALQDRAFRSFADGLFAYGHLVGEFFQPAQGGVFSSKLSDELTRFLTAQRQPLPVQTSWGPTCAIPCESQKAANELMTLIRQQFDSTSMSLQVAEPMNTPAIVRETSTDLR